jgi:hypothetical protein
MSRSGGSCDEVRVFRSGFSGKPRYRDISTERIMDELGAPVDTGGCATPL